MNSLCPFAYPFVFWLELFCLVQIFWLILRTFILWRQELELTGVGSAASCDDDVYCSDLQLCSTIPPSPLQGPDYNQGTCHHEDLDTLYLSTKQKS